MKYYLVQRIGTTLEDLVIRIQNQVEGVTEQLAMRWANAYGSKSLEYFGMKQSLSS